MSWIIGFIIGLVIIYALIASVEFVAAFAALSFVLVVRFVMVIVGMFGVTVPSKERIKEIANNLHNVRLSPYVLGGGFLLIIIYFGIGIFSF